MSRRRWSWRATPQAVLIAEEPFEDAAVVEALYTEEPDAAYLSSVVGRTITVAPALTRTGSACRKRACRRCGPDAFRLWRP